jgi:hypothetical protein
LISFGFLALGLARQSFFEALDFGLAGWPNLQFGRNLLFLSFGLAAQSCFLFSAALELGLTGHEFAIWTRFYVQFRTNLTWVSGVF